MPRKAALATPEAAARDHDLVERLRQGERRAAREFFRRFRPLLAYLAERNGVDAGLCDEIATQCLNNAFLALLRDHTTAPQSLTAYLITALRNAVKNNRRAEHRDLRRKRSAVREGAGLGEWIISESCSEHTLNASEGPDHEPPAAARPLERLAATLDEGLTGDERRILGGISKGIPQREIAEWLGIPYATLRSRVGRLRDRLREAAERYSGHLDGDEQRIVKEFIGRASPVRRGSDTDSRVATREKNDRLRTVMDETNGG